MNERRACQHALLPAIVFALTKDALAGSQDKDEIVLLTKINQIADKVARSYAPTEKLLRRVDKSIHKTIQLFVDARDGRYHIRKVILALHGATQIALDSDLINNEVALVVQDALNLEGRFEMKDEDWIKLKQSADKKVEEIVKIIHNV